MGKSGAWMCGLVFLVCRGGMIFVGNGLLSMVFNLCLVSSALGAFKMVSRNDLPLSP